MSRCIHSPLGAFVRVRSSPFLSSRNNARRVSAPGRDTGPTPINKPGTVRVNRPHSTSSIAIVEWTSSALCFEPAASSAFSPPHPLLLLLLPAVRAFTQHAPRPFCWSCSGISRPPPRRPRVCSGHLLCPPRLFSSSRCTMSATKIGGTAIAKKIRERLRSEIEGKQAKNPLYKPCLKIIQGRYSSLFVLWASPVQPG